MPNTTESGSDLPSEPRVSGRHHVSFELSLNNAVYQNSPSAAQMSARMTIRSNVNPPLILEFFSLQRFDFLIINSAGSELYRWSAGRVFPMIASNVPIEGEEHWTVDVPLSNAQGTPFPSGEY